MGFQPSWYKATSFKKLSKKDVSEIKDIVDEYIAAYKSDDLDRIRKVNDKYLATLYQDVGRIFEIKGVSWKIYRFMFKAMFHGDARTKFQSAKEYNIKLSDANPKVINVTSKNGAQLIYIQSKFSFQFFNGLFQEEDDKKKKECVQEYNIYSLNFIKINGKWQIY